MGHDAVSPQDDEHGESEHAEAQAAVTPKSPVLPSKSEIREHCLTHLPFRPWCRHCIRGKAPALAHKEPSSTEYTKPLVAVDYCFLSSSEGNANESPVVVVKSKPDMAVFARLVPSKGCVHEYSAQALADVFRVLGYREFILKTDGEPSLVAVARAAVDLLPVEVKVNFEHSPVEESEANGFVERACRSVQEQARTLLSMLHERLKCQFPANHAVFPWLIRHASWLLHHFHKTASGRTAHQNLRGRPWREPIFEFGAAVVFKLKAVAGKLAPRWSEGCYLGTSDLTTERFVLCFETMKVVKVWSVRASHETQLWSHKEKLLSMKATPWGLSAEGAEAPRIVVPEMPAPSLPVPVVVDTHRAPRRAAIRLSDALKFGSTPVCDGCDKLKRGLYGKHTDECRTRFEAAWKASGDEELVSKATSADERRDKWLARQVEKYDEELKAAKRARVEQPGAVAAVAEASAAPGLVQEARSASSKRPAEQPPEAMDESRVSEPESMRQAAPETMTDSFESILQEATMTGSFESTLQEAIMKHRTEVFSMDASVPEPICDEPSLCEQSHSKDCWDEYFDDVSGLGLNSGLVELAKKEELRIADEMSLWTPILRSDLPPGTKVIPTKWVLVNKGDSESPSYRARIVAKEVKGHKPSEVGFYASTPPTESLRALIAVATTNQEYVMDFVDISRAHWCADATRYVVVELPPEKGMPDHVAVLKKSLYGTRDAAHNWEQKYTKVLLSLGFLQGRASSCLFYHPLKDIRLEVHGDDFVSVARALDIKWLHERFREAWKCKFCATLSSSGQSVRILGRLLSREASGYSLEADPRHAEIIINSLGLKNAKGLSTAGVKLQSEEEAELSQRLLSPADTTSFRSCVMRAAYMSSERPDCQYCVKELAREMSSPTEASMRRLRRLGRYLISHRRMLIWFEWQEMPRDLVVETDADFAGCGKTRKSTSGGVVFFGSSPIRSYSSNQAVIALSTGESEFYGMLKGSSQAIGLRSLFADIGIEIGIRLCTDSSAGKALAEKKGLGRAKHLHTQYLWLQDRVASKDLKVFKICTDVNRADIFTKHLHEARASALLSAMNCRFATGKHSLALAAS